MTVVVRVGRRVPRKWFRRLANRTKGLLTFQENIWQIINQSFSKAKRKANKDGRLKFNITKNDEIEDEYYYIEWMIVTVQGPKEMENEEYNEAMKMYDKLSKNFKKDFGKDENLAKQLNTKILSKKQVEEAYEHGYGAMEENNISNKLLEMGILTHVEYTPNESNEVELGFDM